MSIKITGIISNENDITISLGHSARGVYQDLTEHLVYELSEEDETDEEEDRIWKINMSLPYPYSQASGDLTLSVGDSHGGDITTTRLIIMKEENEGKEVAPFFDPVPTSVKTYSGQDVLINTRVNGSTPIKVSLVNEPQHWQLAWPKLSYL